MFADGLHENEQAIEAIKQALLSTGTPSVADLWPDYFEEPTEVIDAGTPEAEEALRQGAKEDYSGVTWLMPSSEGGMDEYESLMREVRENQVSVFESVNGAGEDGWL